MSWGLYLANSPLRAVFGREGATGAEYADAGGGNIQVGQWHHLAGTYDGSNLRIYVDGVLRGPVPTTRSVPAATMPLTLGAWSSGAGNRPAGVADVAVYTSALSAAQVQAHYNARD